MKGSLLKRVAVTVGIYFQIASALAAGTDSPPLGLFENSAGSPALKLLQNAQKTIDIEIYEMEDTAIRKAVRAALRHKIKVRVVHESQPVGSSCRLFAPDVTQNDDSSASEKISNDCADLKALMKEIRNAGGAFKAFNREELCGVQGQICYEHGKMLIIDAALPAKRRLLISSGNLNPTSLCSLDADPAVCDRDYSYVTDDADLIRSMQRVFEKDLIGKKYDIESVLSEEAAKRLTISPISLEPITAFIGSAQETLLIQNQYLKDKTLNDAIMAAAKRGVRVEVMEASPCSFSPPSAGEVRKFTSIHQGFDSAGVETRIFSKRIKIKGRPGYLHAKAIIADDRAWIGSINGSETALTKNREFGIFFDDANQVEQLREIMMGDYRARGAETWEESLECN